jgi:type I restriction enzyme S subunit
LQSVFAKPGKDWSENSLKNLTLKIGSGATPRGGKTAYKKEGISLIRSMNVHDRCFKDKNLAFIDNKQANDLSNVTLEKGDILLNITGASVARCCVFPEKYLPARVNQHVSIIRSRREKINYRFLNFLLTSKFYKDQLLKIGEQGATRQAITKAQLENLIIAAPNSLSEQKAIVAKLEALAAETGKLEGIYRRKLADLGELKKSVLRKAFSGEL